MARYHAAHREEEKQSAIKYYRAHREEIRQRRAKSRRAKICGICGASFMPTANSAKYCSPACRKAASKAAKRAWGLMYAKEHLAYRRQAWRRRHPRPIRKCWHCGRGFSPRSSKKYSGAGDRRYCSYECGREATRIQRAHHGVERICGVCHIKFRTKSSQRRYCGPECSRLRYRQSQREYQRRNYIPKGIRTKACRHCGVIFDVTHSQKRYCSLQCRDAKHYQRKLAMSRAWKTRNYERFRKYHRAYLRRRRLEQSIVTLFEIGAIPQ